MSGLLPQHEIDAQANALLEGAPRGDALTPLQAELIAFALSATATSLDMEEARRRSRAARTHGATTAQLQEIVTLVTGVGVHAFFEASRMLAAQDMDLESRGPFDPERQEIWDTWVGERAYWTAMQEEIPGFLESLLWLSPTDFVAFLEYVAVPFRSRHVDTLTKELIGMASDACRSHCYLPGMRMHLRNALGMGAGERAIRQALQIAAHSAAATGIAYPGVYRHVEERASVPTYGSTLELS